MASPVSILVSSPAISTFSRRVSLFDRSPMSASSAPDAAPDNALLRGLTQRRLGRRDALRISGLSALGAALTACGVQGRATAGASAAPDVVQKFWSGKTKTGHVAFANWPLYMDPKKPELKQFT